MKHGLFAKAALLKGESAARLNSLLIGLRNDLKPEGALEDLLVDKLAALTWLERRLIIMVGEQTKEGLQAVILGDNSPGQNFDLLPRYKTNLDRAFERSLSQLERLQRIRKGQPVPPTLNLNVSR